MCILLYATYTSIKKKSELQKKKNKHGSIICYNFQFEQLSKYPEVVASGSFSELMETINQKAKEGFSQKFIDPFYKYSSTNYMPAIMLAVGNTMVNKTRCRLTLMEHLSSGGDQIYFCIGEGGKAHKSIKQRNLTLLKKSKGFSEVVLKLRYQRSEVKGSRKRTF